MNLASVINTFFPARKTKDLSFKQSLKNKWTHVGWGRFQSYTLQTDLVKATVLEDYAWVYPHPFLGCLVRFESYHLAKYLPGDTKIDTLLQAKAFVEHQIHLATKKYQGESDQT